MSLFKSLGPLLSATARERRKQVPVRVLLSGIVAWALHSAGHGSWIPAWLASVAVIQVFEIGAMFRFMGSDRIPTASDICLALTSTFLMAALFAWISVMLWSFDGRGLPGMAC